MNLYSHSNLIIIEKHNCNFYRFFKFNSTQLFYSQCSVVTSDTFSFLSIEILKTIFMFLNRNNNFLLIEKL